MMRFITGRKRKQNSLKSEKKHSAKFVIPESSNTVRLKYMKALSLVGTFRKLKLELKRKVNTFLSRPINLVRKVDWKKVMNDTGLWFVTVIIEGSTANFATHYLFGISLNPMTIIAHGIVIKQGVEIYWRLKQHGEPRQLPLQNERK